MNDIDVSSAWFLAGYFVGIEHPAFLVGNTLDSAPESDDINPYPVGSKEYRNWKCGFNSAIL